MGLDMYAFSVKQGTEPNEEGNGQVELAYWRKFNALHGFMEDLAREKGFEGTFNCVPVQLTPKDIDELEQSIKEGSLEPRAGFFFGEQTIYPEDVEATVKFIEDARTAFDSGMDVYYDSWW